MPVKRKAPVYWKSIDTMNLKGTNHSFLTFNGIIDELWADAFLFLRVIQTESGTSEGIHCLKNSRIPHQETLKCDQHPP